MWSLKQNKIYYRNRDQKNGYQEGEGGRMGEEGKGNRVINIVLSLQGDRWSLELVGDHIMSHKNVKSLYCAPETNMTNIIFVMNLIKLK